MTNKEKELLIEIICEKQTKMIVRDPSKYQSEKYRMLECVKVKIKDL